METEKLERIVSSAELRNPKVFNASRERYVAEISYKAALKEVGEWLGKLRFSPNFPHSMQVLESIKALKRGELPQE